MSRAAAVLPIRLDRCLRHCRRAPILALAAVAIAAFAGSTAAQIPPLEIPRPPQYPTPEMRREEQRRLDDQQLRSEITGNRVSRQTEISRLAAQLHQLDARLQSLERRRQSSDLADIVALLNATPLTAPQQPPALPPRDVAAGAAGDNSVAADAAAPKGVTSADAMPDAVQQRQQTTRLLVGDYLLALRGEMLEARAAALRETDQLRVLERFAAKGQATAGQLELQQFRQQQAAIHNARLQRQWDALLRMLPPGLADELAPLIAADPAAP